MFATLKKLIPAKVRAGKAPARTRRSLQVEALEDRSLLTVTVQVVGTTLNIGSSNPNAVLNETVFIYDRGLDSGSGNITIQLLGGSQQVIATPIRTINVNLGRGNDTVNYNMIGQLRVEAARAIHVNLGDGNDSCIMTMRDVFGAINPLGNGTTFQLNVNGGTGADSVRLHLQNNVTDSGGNFTSHPWSLGDGSRFSANLQGGVGNDVMRIEQGIDPLIVGGLNPVGVFGGSLSLAMNGGEGNDILSNRLVASVQNTPTRTATYINSLSGAGGNDLLQVVPTGLMQATNAKWGGGVAMRLDGGAGRDFLQAMVNADVALTGAFEASILGGVGADNASLDYRGRLDGHLFLNMDGGLGNDMVGAILNIARLSKGKVGAATFPSTVRGGAGNDFVRFQAAHTVNDVTFSARMLGDAGSDVGLHSPTTVQARSTAEGGDLETLFPQDLES